MKGKYKWTIRLTLWTPLLIILSIFLAGGGHGYYEPMIFLFPFSAICFIWFDEINLLFVLISLSQYPLYGLLIDKIGYRNNHTKIVILIIHLTIAIIAYTLRPEQFR